MSWLSDILHFGRKQEISKEVALAKIEAQKSQQRLAAIKKVEARVDKVAEDLKAKHYRNGWGETIAETMRRAK